MAASIAVLALLSPALLSSASRVPVAS